MKIAMNEAILGIDGKEIKEPLMEKGVKVGDSDKTVILVDLITTAMTTTLKSDLNEKGEEPADSLLKKWDIAQRAHAARGELLEISTDEATFIKERIRKVFASVVFYANAHRIIEAAGK